MVAVAVAVEIGVAVVVGDAILLNAKTGIVASEGGGGLFPSYFSLMASRFFRYSEHIQLKSEKGSACTSLTIFDSNDLLSDMSSLARLRMLKGKM